MTDKLLMLVTCGSAREGRKIAKAVVGERLAACVNVVGAPVESIYRWEGKISSAKEILLLIKTTRGRFQKLRDRILELHSYDVPEIIAVPIAAGSKKYLDWIAESVVARRSR